jgi:hypothetical protein
MHRLGQSPPPSGREGLHAVDPRGMFPPVLLADPTHRSQACIPGLHQQFLQRAYRAALSTWRGVVHPFLEAADVPLDFFPGDALPGRHQGLALWVDALPLTHGFPLQHTGPPSAYPGHSSRPLLLRASSAPTASGWHLLREGDRLHRGPLGVTPFPVPMARILRAVLSTGVLGSAYRSVFPAAGAFSFACWLQRMRRLRGVVFTVAQPHLRLRCP